MAGSSGLQNRMRPLWPTGLCWDVCFDRPTQEASIHAWPQPQWELPGHGWRLNHFPGQPVPMLDNPFSEVKFPNIQSKPPPVQLEAISSPPITCYLGEETDPHLSTTSFQAKQSQLPQPLLIRLLLQTLHQLHCPSLDTLQHLNVSLVVKGPKLNTVFEVRPHQCRVQGHDHFSGPASHTISDISQDAIGILGHLGTLLAHIQVAVNQNTQVLLCWAAFQPLFLKPVALHGVVVTQVQDLALGLVEPHTIGLSPLIQPVQIPLQSLPTLKQINTPAQLGVVCKLTEETSYNTQHSGNLVTGRTATRGGRPAICRLHLAHVLQGNPRCSAGWRPNHFPGQPVPMLDNPFSEVKFPNIQSKPPVAQLEAISSCPVTSYLGEETDPHLSTTSFQAKQSQLPQPLLIRLLLQTLHQLCCPSLDTLQHLNVSLVVKGPKLNTVFEVRPHQCRAAFQPLFPKPVVLHGGAVAQVQDLALGLVKPHTIDLGPSIQPVEVPLQSLPALQQINTPTQLGVICKLAESALDPFIQIIDKDVKQNWPQHRALGNTACDWPPTGVNSIHHHSLGPAVQPVLYPVKSTPVQAMSSQFLQENAVGNRVKGFTEA
ncbi:hypothetical protein QYF61_006012 [Mycteria americana]|uniref:Uncharacterized protein n=1 Tax=Mycteria americana TaxID=33587 RepID=A0AAN7SBD0_MYCAM|nr:hypothetical protein QYF61_006012 [Mycteria americana]